MKPGEIIYANFEHPSFNWQNGLYIVISIKENTNEVNICRIDDKGKPSLFDDGRYMCSTTGLNNPYLLPTKLSYKLEDNPKHN